MESQIELEQKIVENKKNESKEKPHPIMAGVIDFFIYATILSACMALYSSLMGEHILSTGQYAFVPYIILVFGIVVFCIAYYLSFGSKIKWLSYGEQIVGRVLIDGTKKWNNPYGVNRIGLFVLIFIQLIVVGNNFDSDKIIDLPIIIGKLINTSLIAYALLQLGKGKLNKGMIILTLLHAFVAWISFRIGISYLIIFSMIQLILDIVVWMSYRNATQMD